MVRERQIARARKFVENPSSISRKKPNDPKRFIEQGHCTADGETASKTITSLNQQQIDNEAKYDGFYAICTNLDYDVAAIIRINQKRWEIEECFRIMKTDFEARPVFLHDDVRIKAHFLICFLSLVIYRYLERELEHAFTCETILDKLKTINFADIQEQGFIPLYTRDKLTDALHEICGFDTDFKFITKSHMKTIQKKSKGRK